MTEQEKNLIEMANCLSRYCQHQSSCEQCVFGFEIPNNYFRYKLCCLTRGETPAGWAIERAKKND